MTPRPRSALVLGLVLTVLVSCGDNDSGTNNSASTTATSFALEIRPQFVNRVIAGRRPIALITVTGSGAQSVALSATATPTNVEVEFVPTAVAPGSTAEIWAVVPTVTEDVPVSLTITGTRDSTTRSAPVGFTAIPGVDDLAGTARDIAQVFLRAIGNKVPGLPIDAGDLTAGTPVAGLLVVSHYAWFTADLEVGLSWHIMVAPDDWAEMYIRPRSSAVPTRAFRIRSWSTALAGGTAEVSEISPPADVTR